MAGALRVEAGMSVEAIAAALGYRDGVLAGLSEMDGGGAAGGDGAGVGWDVFRWASRGLSPSYFTGHA